jgi:DNA-binding NtrC family response regulator
MLGKEPGRGLLTATLKFSAGLPYQAVEFLRTVTEARAPLTESTSQGPASFSQFGGEAAVSLGHRFEDQLKGLPNRPRELLRILSALGGRGSISALAELIRAESLEVLEWAMYLRRKGYCDVLAGVDETQLAMRGEWIGKVLETLESRDSFRDYYRRIAELYEATDPAQSDLSALETICRSYLKAGLPDRALPYLWELIASFERHSFFDQARELLDQALVSGAVLGDDEQVAMRRTSLLFASGQLDECLLSSKALLERAGARRTRARLHWLMGRAYDIRGETGKALDSLNNALSCLDEEEEENYQVKTEILSEFLSSLSRSVNPRAKEVAAQLIQRLKSAGSRDPREKAFHALYFFCIENGFTQEAVRWERKSLRAAYREGSQVRCAGRAFNLSATYLKSGEWNQSRRLNDFCAGVASNLNHPQVKLFYQMNRAILARKLGQHSTARERLRDIAQSNRGSCRNPHIENEVRIELAKNWAYELLLEKGMDECDQLQDMRRHVDVSSSAVDASLAYAWICILLGKADRAGTVLSDILGHATQRDRGRLLLLRSRIQLDTGSEKEAEAIASRALNEFPPSVPYFRARTRLYQAQVALRLGNLRKANAFASDALLISRRKDYPTIRAGAHCVKGQILGQKGESRIGRAHALRAQQLARSIERPDLLRQVHSCLAFLEEALGRRSAAILHLNRAIDYIQKPYLKLSSRNRRSFFRLHLEPLFLERARLTGKSSSEPPQFLIRLREFVREIQEQKDRHGFALEIVRTIEETVPQVSVKLHSGRGNESRLVVPTGSERRDGSSYVDRKESSGSDSVLQFCVGNGNSPRGILSVTVRKRVLSEVEYDFIECLASIAGSMPIPERIESVPTTHQSKSPTPSPPGSLIVGRHPLVIRLRNEISRIAVCDATVLLEGETGTGKELVARALHELSRRRGRHFVPINCAALPPTLIENELFGHVRGSFSGASQSKAGLFELASNGTLFLDEISSLPLELQPRLLRALEEQAIRRLGDLSERRINVRIVAAANQNLRSLVEQGEFRSDLFHRLNVVRIEIPALRDRLSDIPLLAQHFLDNLNRKQDRDVVLTARALHRLQTYAFPGNVRELKNVIEGLFVLSDSGKIAEDDVVARLPKQDALYQQHNQERVERIFEMMISGRADFNRAVRQPFLDRELCRGDVREIITRGLIETQGSYRKLVELFGLDHQEYKRFLAFLQNHRCKVDYRAFRAR